MAKFIQPSRLSKVMNISSSMNRCKKLVVLTRPVVRTSCGCTPPPPPCKVPARDPCHGSCPPPPPPPPCPPVCPCPDPPDCTPEPGSGHGKQWRNISFFVALPILLILTTYTFMRDEEEKTKPRKEFIPYSYLYRRTKRWPWGDGNHSLFHNPKTNPIPPYGYEVEDENAAKKTGEDDS